MESVVQERLGAITTTMTSSFPSGPSRANTDFQPPYFPPPFGQQSGEMFGHHSSHSSHSQNINDPYSPALHCFQTSQVPSSIFQPHYSVLTSSLVILELLRLRGVRGLRAGEERDVWRETQ